MSLNCIEEARLENTGFHYTLSLNSRRRPYEKPQL